MLPRSALHDEQVKGIEYIKDGFETFLIADVGAGKTVMILTAILDLINTGDLRRVLVVGPKTVSETVWHNELLDWEHLNGVLDIGLATGSPAKRAAVIEDESHDIVCLSYDNLVWFSLNYGKSGLFDAISFDEIDMMSSTGSQRFKKLRWLVKHFDTRIGCTATPTATDLLNLWAQAYLLDKGAALGTSFNRFRDKFFYATDYNMRNWEPHEGAEEKIFALLGSLVCRVKSTNPRNPPIEREISVELNADTMVKYQKLTKKKELELPGGLVEAKNEASLSGKQLQIAAGFSYADAPDGSEITVWHDKAKFDKLGELVSKHKGEQIMIVYQFIAQLEEIQRRFAGITTKFTPSTIEAWNAGLIDLAAAHPKSMSHGLNLQKNGARVIIFLTPPYTYRTYNQVIGRFNRQGNPYDDVLAYLIVSKGTRDIDALVTLQHREHKDKRYIQQMEKNSD